MSSSHSRARVSQRLRWALGWFTSAVLRLVPWQPFSNRCALHRAGVPCEAHLFEKGVHGTSISTAEVDAADPHRAHWVALCLEWLGETFGFKLS